MRAPLQNRIGVCSGHRSGRSGGGTGRVVSRFDSLVSAALVVVAVLMLFAARVETGVQAGVIAASEYEVKAAYVFKFAVFTEFPADRLRDDGEPFVIGVLGNERVENALRVLSGSQEIHRRAVRVLAVKPDDRLEMCHVLFIGKGQDSRAILGKLGTASVLTVGEDETFSRSGGIFTLVLVDENVRFDSNPKAITRAGLAVTSRVLKLSRRFTGGQGGQP